MLGFICGLHLNVPSVSLFFPLSFVLYFRHSSFSSSCFFAAVKHFRRWCDTRVCMMICLLSSQVNNCHGHLDVVTLLSPHCFWFGFAYSRSSSSSSRMNKTTGVGDIWSLVAVVAWCLSVLINNKFLVTVNQISPHRTVVLYCYLLPLTEKTTLSIYIRRRRKESSIIISSSISRSVARLPSCPTKSKQVKINS